MMSSKFVHLKISNMQLFPISYIPTITLTTTKTEQRSQATYLGVAIDSHLRMVAKACKLNY